MKEVQSIMPVMLHYLDLMRRGKYLVIIPVTVSLIVAAAVAWKLPPVYRSEVRILYMQPQVPEWTQVQSVNVYLEAMLVFAKAMTLGRDNCIKIINQLNLYPELVDSVPMDDVIAQMQDAYQQKMLYTAVPTKSGKSEDVVTGFEFSFEYSNPAKTFQIANILATDFLEFYKKFREGFATSTSSFFEDERKRLETEIAEIDQQMSQFKEQHITELPELFQMNYRMIDMLQTRLMDIDRQIRQLDMQRGNIEMNLATMNPYMAMEGTSGQRIVTPEEKLTALRYELDLLQAQYSDQHPDVVRVRQEIVELTQVVEGRGSESVPEPSFRGIGNGFQGAYNPAYVQLVTSIENIDAEVKSLVDEREELRRKLQEYEIRVGKTPFVEKQYNALFRGLESAQRRYDELANQVLKLETAAAMEKREMGGKLTIGQPPSFPLRPVKPNRVVIVATGGFLGLVCGVLLLLGWDLLTRTIRTTEDLNAVSGLPTMIEVPLISVQEYRSTAWIRRHGWTFGAIAVLVLAVFLIDAFYIKIDVLLVKILEAVRRKLVLMGW